MKALLGGEFEKRGKAILGALYVEGFQEISVGKVLKTNRVIVKGGQSRARFRGEHD